MARKPSKRRRPAGAARWRRAGLLLAAALVAVAALIGWHKAHRWRPDEALFPDQGALIGEADGPVAFDRLKGIGAGFVYLEASHGAGHGDARFAGNLAAARETGLMVGAVHDFDPCVPADGQSARFVTMVPRDAALLPPVIAMTRLADSCPTRVSEAAVQSEVTTLVNQIEAHVGKPAILAPSREFETAYGVARRIDRTLWLTRPFLKPGYGGRPWVMWTANPAYDSEAAAAPVRWAVVQP